MKKKLFLFLTPLIIVLSTFFLVYKNNNTIVIDENSGGNKNLNKLISVLVDGVEQSAFPSKGSAEYQETRCTNNETAIWDSENWKLSIQDISSSTRCVVSFATGGHSVFVTVSGGTVDSAPKNVSHNGNVTFTVSSSNANYVFSSAKCTNAQSYSWANNILSVNGVTADSYCEVVFARPTYTVYFDVVGGYTEHNYLTVVRGGGNSTTYGAVAGFLSSGSTITCDPGITGKLAGERVVVSNVLASGDCIITCARDTSNYLPAGGIYTRGDEVSYANLAWSVITSDAETVTLILKGNAIYSSTSSSNPTGTGIFGSGITYTSSSARSYIVDIWLEQDSQKYLRNAIDTGGLKYQDDANGYLRLPYATEISRDLPNASNTNFWTMDNDGANHMYYGQPDGYLTEGYNTSDKKYYYEYYTLANNSAVTYEWSTKLSGTFTNNSGSSTGTGTGTASTTGNDKGISRTTSQFYSTGCISVRTSHCSCSSLTYPSCTSSGANVHGINMQTAANDANYRFIAAAGITCDYYQTSDTSCRNTGVSCCNTYQCGGGTGFSCSQKTATLVSKWNITAKFNVTASVVGKFSGSSTTSNNVTVSKSHTSHSGTAGANGSSGTAYKKVTKGAYGSEVKNSAATLKTTHTYNAITNSTVGNSSMTTGVQAVSPNASEARINDTAPSTASTNTVKTSITHAAQNTVSLGTAIACTSVTSADATAINSLNSVTAVNSYNAYVSGATSGTFYQGNGGSCSAIAKTLTGSNYASYNAVPAASNINTSAVTTPAVSTVGSESVAPANVTSIKTGSIAANTATAVSASTYTRYTLQQNSSPMGYRPVIVVYKAN